MAKTNGSVFTFEAIGFIETCFPDLRGTPRQGILTPSSRGRIALRPSVISKHALENVEEYAFVWLTFVFSRNVPKSSDPSLKGGHTRRAKILAPKNDSKKKVGVFSTRSPHRPNPIGQTLAKVEKVEGNVLHLSGVDLVDGTPILDIKPYVSHYDAVPDARVPVWVKKAYHTKPLRVDFSPAAREQLESLVDVRKIPKFYDSSTDVLQVLREVISQDMQSGNTRRRHEHRRQNKRFDAGESGATKEKDGYAPRPFCFSFDGLRIECSAVEDASVRVERVTRDERGTKGGGA